MIQGKSAFLLFVLLAGCSSVPSKGGGSVSGINEISTPENKAMTRILEAYEAGEFEKTVKATEDFERDYRVSKYLTTALFYKGAALEHLGRFEEAIEPLRFVVKTGGGTTALEATALVHLGICYEGLGDQARTIAVLADAERREHHLPDEVGRVEVPARLAGAYARYGNEAMASKYYAKAEKGLTNLLRGNDGKKQPEWFSKTLYNMGRMSIRKMAEVDFESGLKPIERAQTWLLRAAELGHPTWSRRASEELIKLYRDAWGIIESTPIAESDDHILAAKEQHTKMVSMGVVLQAHLSKLRLERLPENEGDTHYVQDIFDYLGGLEKKLSMLLEAKSFDTVPTQESLEREGLKRKGTIIDNATPPPQQSTDPNL